VGDAPAARSVISTASGSVLRMKNRKGFHDEDAMQTRAQGGRVWVKHLQSI
jgi:hypothetical protein